MDTPPFSSHLLLAHFYWERLLNPGDAALDATCGNGNDTLFISKKILKKDTGRVFGLDIQQKAIEQTRSLLNKNLNLEEMSRVHLFERSHENLPSFLCQNSLKLVVYNLGYLPGSDKQITTKKETTVQSIIRALDLITIGGAVSITCYPGHQEGALEQKAVLAFASNLSPKKWDVLHHQWINRNECPSLLIIKKKT